MKKLNMGSAIPTAPPTAKSKHASVTVGGRLEELLAQFVVVNPEYKRYKAQHETLSRDIGAETRPLYFDTFAGVVPQSSTMLAEAAHQRVKLIVKDRYPQSFENFEALVKAIGKANAERHFEWKAKYAVDYEKIPAALQEPFAEAIEAARVKIGVPAEAVTAKQYLAPKGGFHESRTLILTPEQNKALDALMPVTAYAML